MDHLKSMTVATLKAIASQMSVPFNSRMKKADLIEVISAQIEKDHIRAIEDDELINVGHVATDTMRQAISQTTAWFKRHGLDELETTGDDIRAAIERDRVEALDMNAAMTTDEKTYTVPGTTVVYRGEQATLLINHENRVKRYNPTLARRKDGKVILTAKQRRRVGKKIKVEYKRLFGAF